MQIQFEWDEDKNRSNKKKHAISFEEAATVFSNFPLEITWTRTIQNMKAAILQSDTATWNAACW